MPSYLVPQEARNERTWPYWCFITFIWASSFSLFSEMIEVYSLRCFQLPASSASTSVFIFLLVPYLRHNWQNMKRMNQKWSRIFSKQIDLLTYIYLLRSKYSPIISVNTSPIFNLTMGGSCSFSYVFSMPSTYCLLTPLAHRNALTLEQFMSGMWQLVLAGQYGLASSTAYRVDTEISWLRILFIKLLQRLKMPYSSELSLPTTIWGSSRFSQVPIHFYPASIKS